MVYSNIYEKKKLDNFPIGFGFIEFESEKDADDVVRNFNGKAFMGSELIVEFAKESRPRRQYDDRGGGYVSP